MLTLENHTQTMADLYVLKSSVFLPRILSSLLETELLSSYFISLVCLTLAKYTTESQCLLIDVQSLLNLSPLSELNAIH